MTENTYRPGSAHDPAMRAEYNAARNAARAENTYGLDARFDVYASGELVLTQFRTFRADSYAACTEAARREQMRVRSELDQAHEVTVSVVQVGRTDRNGAFTGWVA